MEFEDRLQGHLSQQAQNITITSEDPSTVANRSMARRRRTMSTVVAGFVVAACGFGFAAMNAGGPSETPTIVADEGEITAQIDDSQSTDNAQDIPVDPASVNVTVDGSIEAISVPTDNSPGTYFTGAPVVADGVYYVLSTEPGKSEVESYEWDRPNTLYSFEEGSGWSIAPEPDRFLSDLTASNGLLYAVSTGSISGAQDLQIGTSPDRGQSWTWSPLDLEIPSEATVSIEAVGERVFVHAQTLPVPDWQEALDLLVAADVPVNSNNLWGITDVGFTYMPMDDAAFVCSSLRNEWYNVGQEIYEASADAPFFEGPMGEDEYVQPTPAEIEAFEAHFLAIETEVQTLRDQVRPDFEARLAAAGCDNFIQCETVSADVVAAFSDEQNAINERYNDMFSEFGPNNPPDDEFFVSPEMMELDETSRALHFRIETAISKALAENGCDENWYFDEVPESNPDDAVTATWAEVGIVPPESWSGSRSLMVITNGVAETLPVPWGTDIATAVASDGSTLQATTMTADDYLGRTFPTEPTNETWLPPSVTWSTTDGLNWTSTTGTGYGNRDYYGGGATIGDRTFRIGYDAPDFEPPMPIDPETGEPVPVPTPTALSLPGAASSAPVAPPLDVMPIPVAPPVAVPAITESEAAALTIPMIPDSYIEVSTAGGPYTRLDLAGLGLGDDLGDRPVQNVYATPVGVLILVGAFDGGQTAVLHSADGSTWGRIDMNSGWVNPMVGSDSVMLFGERYTDQGEAETEIVLLRAER